MIFSNYNSPKLCKNVQELFCQVGVLCRELKMTKHYFWTNVMLRQTHIRTSRNSPAQKLQDLRVVYSKNFLSEDFFVFWGTRLVGRFLSYLPVKQIWKKSTVCGRPPHYSPLRALTSPCAPLPLAPTRLPKHSVIIQAGLVICSRRSFFLPLKLPFILLFWPPRRMGAAPTAAARRATTVTRRADRQSRGFCW
jgi:hypothetical protein